MTAIYRCEKATAHHAQVQEEGDHQRRSLLPRTGRGWDVVGRAINLPSWAFLRKRVSMHVRSCCRHGGRLRALSAADPKNKAFTLVELLVVIAILAMLAALLTPAVLNSLKKAREAGVKAEIDMLHMALTGYAADNNGALPPSSGDDNARLHLFRLFPRIADWTNMEKQELLKVGALVPGNALYIWLRGYGRNERYPVSEGPRLKYYDFDQSRVTAGGTYHPPSRPSSPYIYIDRTQYGQVFGGYAAQKDSNGEYFNPDTFQILCAGVDGVWGNEDDLTNFWNGTRRDYKNSQQ